MYLNETVRVHPVPQDKRSIFVFDSFNAPKEINLTSFGKQEITFGRDAGNDIVLTSHLASRHHGAFVLENEQWFIVDKGSTNGIIHNGREEAKIALRDDDFIRIDDGVETVSDGVLMLFPSKEYSASWVTTPIVEVKSYLSNVPALAEAYIEQRNDAISIELSNTDAVLVNQRRAKSKITIHEKDVISVPGHRIVFTSAAIYDNIQAYTPQYSEQPSEKDFAVPVEEKGGDVSNVSSEQYVADSIPVVNEIKTEKQYEEPVIQPQVTETIQQEYYQPNGHQEQVYQQQNNYSVSQKSSGGFRNFLASPAGYYVMSIVIALVIWGITVAIWASAGEAALIVILACAFFGWKALNSIQPAMFLWMSWTGWIIYFCVKFILSAIIGLFVAPFKIGKWIAGAINESI